MDQQPLAAALPPAERASSAFTCPQPGSNDAWDANWRRLHEASRTHPDWLTPEEWRFAANCDGRLLLTASQANRLRATFAKLRALSADAA
jgi:hypothetical protein